MSKSWSLCSSDSDDDSTFQSPSSRDSDCSLVSVSSIVLTGSKNNPNKRKITDESAIAGASTAKRFKALSPSSSSTNKKRSNEKSKPSTSKQQQKRAKRYIDLTVKINYNSPRFQPELVNVWLTKQQIDEYINPSSNKKTENDESGKSTSKKSVKATENEIDIQTDCNGSNTSNHVKNTRQVDPNSIDYKSWQWQPKICIAGFSEPELETDENEKSDNSCVQVEPIRFDKEQSVIREFSPQSGDQQFNQRILAIKKSQTVKSAIKSATGGTRPKKRKVTNDNEYPTILKELQSKKRLNGRTGARKLFSLENSHADEDENQNAIQVKTGREHLKRKVKN